jgi:hypothetical protein
LVGLSMSTNSATRVSRAYHEIVRIARDCCVTHTGKFVALPYRTLVEQNAGDLVVDDKMTLEQPDPSARVLAGQQMTV